MSNLKVIGSGIGKTGTMSLRFALIQLKISPCYHGAELLKADFIDDNFLKISGNSNLSDVKLWIKAIELKNSGQKAECCEILKKLLNNYQAVVDWPASYFYEELAEMNPEAVVIHTVRDSPEVWLESFSKTLGDQFFEPWMAKDNPLLIDFDKLNGLLVKRPEDLQGVMAKSFLAANRVKPSFKKHHHYKL